MPEKPTLNPDLYKPRSIEDTLRIYGHWAESYDEEVLASGYVTPKRIAQALTDFCTPDAHIVDFGCGTGLSGLALREAGFTRIDGTDITHQMLEKAEERGVYEETWLSDPAELSITQGKYDVIVGAGVISIGGAPSDLLSALTERLPKGGRIAFSYNDATLASEDFMSTLTELLARPEVVLDFEEYGPHLPGENMGSTVYILRRD